MERMTGVEPYTPPWHHAPSILESLKFQPFTVIKEGSDHVVFLKVLPQCYLSVTSVLPQSFGDFPSDSVGNGVQIFVEEIGVSVEGHRRALMPEHPLESLHVGSRMHRDACRRVP